MLRCVDYSVGQMIMKLKDRGLYESTLVIITAKHGQSQIDPYALDKIPGKTNNPRTPDIIVQPNAGVIYTGSGKKVTEHGGFEHDDTNVMLLLSNPALQPRTVFSEVGTLQVAPTILKALGLNPSKLDGVRLEGTGSLPGVNLNFDQQ